VRYEKPVYLSSPVLVPGESAATVVAAVRDGLISEQDARKSGYSALRTTVAPPVELAVQAARRTLKSAGFAAADLDRLVHAWSHYQGYSFGSPTHFLAREIGAVNAVPLGLQQLCNGGTAGIELVAKEIVADDTVSHGLVTAADRFSEPGFDRWGEIGLAYGDGASAVLVGTAPHGRAVRLLASASKAASEFEGMQRGTGPFTATPGDQGRIVPRIPKRQFQDAHPDLDFARTAEAIMRELAAAVLDQSGTRRGDTRLRGVALPRFYRETLRTFQSGLEETTGVPVVPFGSDTGHLGSSDAMANLAELLEAERPGDRWVLISGGGGFTWTALAVETVR
jgi:3-oxoacyl-[acyl-carrier-protein] synthase III